MEATSSGFKLRVAIADVGQRVAVKSAIDRFAGRNGVTVYSGVETFLMLPEKLSYDLTSLVAGQKRRALVAEIQVSTEGKRSGGKVYTAVVQNRAKLDYPTVSAWLDGKGPVPQGADADVQNQLQQQDRLAKILRDARRLEGALDLESSEMRFERDANGISGVAAHHQDRAGSLIEELMIAANRTFAGWLDANGLPSIRRVVKSPERWPNIVQYASERGQKLPAKPSSLALAQFIDVMRKTRAAEFPEISLALIKLIGRGEYAAHSPGGEDAGHFALATMQYAHATAPNRRYVDLVSERITVGSHKYSLDELNAIAEHCSEREAAARSVERRVHKSAAALFLRGRIGEIFRGIVTATGDKGTYVRLLDEPAEGKIVAGSQGLVVGAAVQVQLKNVSVENGFIDFVPAKGRPPAAARPAGPRRSRP